MNDKMKNEKLHNQDGTVNTNKSFGDLHLTEVREHIYSYAVEKIARRLQDLVNESRAKNESQ
jgi:hypothetical protein